MYNLEKFTILERLLIQTYYQAVFYQSETIQVSSDAVFKEGVFKLKYIFVNVENLFDEYTLIIAAIKVQKHLSKDLSIKLDNDLYRYAISYWFKIDNILGIDLKDE